MTERRTEFMKSMLFPEFLDQLDHMAHWDETYKADHKRE